jgi:hypothetical protein
MFAEAIPTMLEEQERRSNGGLLTGCALSAIGPQKREDSIGSDPAHDDAHRA